MVYIVAEKSKLTPVMQQYVDMKSENPDALLMFRLGDFYESFFDDARTISATLGLVLTARGTDGDGDSIPMCGIPWHAADNYFGRLVRAGYKVALVEQMETPQQAKARGHKFIERSIVRVLTPGTLTDENLLTPARSNFLVAITPVRGGAYDIAGCDISTGEFFIGQTSNPTDDLVRINPAEVIFPFGAAEEKNIAQLREMFKSTPVYEKLYIRSDINMVVSRVFGGAVNGDSVSQTPECAICLLAGYLFNTQRGATITFRAPYTLTAGRQLLIDSATWRSLELDAPMHDGGVSLIDVLDETRTSAGARKLRSYLRNLSADCDEINLRQRHITHFVLNPDVAAMVANILSSVPDVGRCISRLLAGRGTPRDLRNVSEFMNVLPRAQLLSSRLDAGFAPLFQNIATHDEFAVRLNRALSDDLPTFFRDGGVIRDGFDVALDNMRSLSNGARETIAALQSEYIEKTGINTLKIKYNNILGYFIEVPSARADAMMNPDSGFIHRQTMAGNVRFTTSRLIDLDNDIRSAAEKSAGIEAQIITDFIATIRTISDDLLSAADLLADADVWTTLAAIADRYSWTRPEMTDDCSFDVIGGRHPVIESVLRTRGDNFVKNDCNLNQNPIALITGPNMAGKSTYLRQNAIIIVLAHLGSYVPATSATIGICDQLFSRVGASDNLAAGQSTFMVEMSETANILNRATPRSFIIFDEIGRGTATYDGMAIAQAVLEYLSDVQPRTLFATHYHELTHLQLPHVSFLTCDVREHNNEIIFMHKMISGVANRSYGIHVARMAGMPSSVVERAQSVLDGLEQGIPTPVPPASSAPVAPVAPDVPVAPKNKNRVSDDTSPQLNLFG